MRSDFRELNSHPNCCLLHYNGQTNLPSLKTRKLFTYKKKENRQQFHLLNDFMVSNCGTADSLIPNP